MATMNVLDSTGGTVAIEKPLTPGRAAAAASRPVVLATEDKTSLDAVGTKLDTLHADMVALAGYVDGLEALETAISGKLPATLGQKAMAASLAVAIASDQSAVPLAASGGAGGIANTARLPSAANTTNATRILAAPGRIYSVCGKNNAAYDIWLVIYDAAVNPPVPGTTTIRKKMVCPAGQAFVYDWPLGLYCASGIGYAFTKLVADADTTVLVAADITGFNVDYS